MCPLSWLDPVCVGLYCLLYSVLFLVPPGGSFKVRPSRRNCKLIHHMFARLHTSFGMFQFYLQWVEQYVNQTLYSFNFKKIVSQDTNTCSLIFEKGGLRTCWSRLPQSNMLLYNYYSAVIENRAACCSNEIQNNMCHAFLELKIVITPYLAINKTEASRALFSEKENFNETSVTPKFYVLLYYGLHPQDPKVGPQGVRKYMQKALARLCILFVPPLLKPSIFQIRALKSSNIAKGTILRYDLYTRKLIKHYFHCICACICIAI